MNEFLLTLLLAFSFVTISHADELKSDIKDPPSFHHGGPCGKLKLEDGQKAQMKEAWYKFREEKIDLKAQVERSRLKYEKLVSDPSTDYKSAKAAAKDVSDSISKMISAKQNFKTKVAFEILKPEQRGPAQFCEHKKHKHGHHHEDWN